MWDQHGGVGEAPLEHVLSVAWDTAQEVWVVGWTLANLFRLLPVTLGGF